MQIYHFFVSNLQKIIKIKVSPISLIVEREKLKDPTIPKL